MRYIITSLLILFNLNSISAQEWDTLTYDLGGEYTVFDRTELDINNQKLGGLFDHSPGLRVLRNFRRFNENDSLIKEVKNITYPNKDTYKLIWENGVKLEESFQSGDSIFRSKYWNKEGYLLIEENLVYNTLISTEYYGDKKNSIKKIVNRRKVINYDEKELDIVDTSSLIGESWISGSYFNSGWLPIGDIVELHMNGQIKAIKKYYPKCYKDKNGRSIFLRDGIWKYFDEKGILTRSETYNNGERIK